MTAAPPSSAPRLASSFSHLTSRNLTSGRTIGLACVVAVIERYWWVWALLALVVTARGVAYLYRERRLTRSGINEIDRMDGRTFEQYLRTAFQRLGYKVEVTKYHGDFGADLVVRKDGRKIAVQAKRYTKNVGVKAIQEAVASKGYYDADAAMVVTNRYYTEQAQTLARKNAVELWDRDRLVQILLRAQTADAPPAATDAALETPTEPACAECGTAVSEKVYAYCRDQAERFDGRIYCFKHQRRFRGTQSSSA
jgi:restriction system protein